MAVAGIAKTIAEIFLFPGSSSFNLIDSEYNRQNTIILISNASKTVGTCR